MFYQNPTYQGAAQGAADKSRQRGQIQRDIVILESDRRKKDAQKMQLDAELREAKKVRERAEIEFQSKQAKLREVERDIAALNVSISGLKKKQI